MTLARGEGAFKHMFGSVLDAEHLFGRMKLVTRTRVRRRRLTVTVSLSLVAAAWAGPAVRALGSPEAPARVSRVSYVVREGDTLWTISRELAPQSDPRPVVDLISAMNGVDAGR